MIIPIVSSKNLIVMTEKTRYSDAELEEFKAIITEKLEKACRDYDHLKAAVMNTDGNDDADTAPTFKVLEEGASTLSKEEAGQLAQRQMKFIQHLKGALIIDGVLFKDIRKEIIRHYERGGLVSISWHVDNPLTGGDSWDVTNDKVVESVLPGGENHEKFQSWLLLVANFLKKLSAWREHRPHRCGFCP